MSDNLRSTADQVSPEASSNPNPAHVPDVFQAGLDNIIRAYETKLDRPLTQEESFFITSQARDFFSRSEGGAGYSNSLANPVNTTTGTPPPYPLTFSALVQLITSGVPLDEHNVPGFKQIPDTLNDQRPSEPKLALEKGAGQKPWQINGLQPDAGTS